MARKLLFLKCQFLLPPSRRLPEGLSSGGLLLFLKKTFFKLNSKYSMRFQTQKNLYPILTILVLLSTSQSDSQILSSIRCIAWHPGILEPVPLPQHWISVKEFGAKGDGETDDSFAFFSALETLKKQGGTLFVPEGTYKLNSSLSIGSRIWIKGEGFEKTVLRFDLGAQLENCIEVGSFQEEIWIPVYQGAYRNSTVIEVEEAFFLSPGDWIELSAENDPSLLYTNPEWDQEWAQNAIGQILRVKSARRNKIELTGPIFLDYPAHWNPKIRRIEMTLYSGIEKCRIERIDRGAGDMIVLRYSAFCGIREIESAFTAGIHVYLYGATHCEVRDSYFHHAHDYGEGGHGYGVDCAHHATENLIENNIFEGLRHSMVVQVGASGNVFGYNYSVDPISSDGIPLPDVVLHGHYPNYNLFESNVVQHIAIGDYWGPAGSGNTFFRNIVESGGIDIEDHSHDQNLIANWLVQDDIRIHPSVNGTLLYRNWIETPMEQETQYPLPTSYYLSQKPEYFGESPWPLIEETGLYHDALPAKQRFTQNHKVTPPPTLLTKESLSLSVYPNPTRKEFYAEFFLPIPGSVSLALFDIRGRQVQIFFNGFLERGYRRWPIRLEIPLVSGVYFLRLEEKPFQVVRKIIFL